MNPSALLLLLAVAAQPGEPGLLSLDEAVSTAIKLNPQIEAAKEKVAAADSVVVEARSSFLPQGTAILNYTRGTSNSPYIPVSPNLDKVKPEYRDLVQSLISTMQGERISSASFNNYLLSVQVDQLIWDFGRSLGTYNAAKASARGSAADLQTTINDTYYTVVVSYFNVLENQEYLKAAEEILKQKEKHLELAAAQVEAGVRPKIDVTRSQADVSTARLALLKAKNALATAKVSLLNAMGTPEMPDFRVDKPAKYSMDLVSELEEAYRIALANRPEYRSIRESLNAVEDTLDIAKSGYYPTLALNGTGSLSGLQIDWLVYNWSVGATATWPFFSGLQTTGAVGEARANILAMKANVRNLELAIRMDVENSLLNLKVAKENLIPARDALTAATETLELAEGRYAAGAGSIIEVTDAQTTFTNATVNYISAEHYLEISIATLLKSLGTIGRKDQL